jgi:membrane protease YdiL (CAAX protease family)
MTGTTLPALAEPAATAAPLARVNWRQVGLFIALTFALTWLLDLAIWLSVGYQASAALGTLLQLQMLLPAFSAILLGLFVFADSPIHVSKDLGRPRWFFYFFLLYTLIYIVMGGLGILSPASGRSAAMVGQSVTLLGLLVLIVLRLLSGRAAFARAGLAGGKLKYWLLFGLGLVLFYFIQTGLNYIAGLGKAVDLAAFLAAVAPSGNQPQMLQMARTAPLAFLAISGAQSIFLSPLIALLITFGEEYGWRGYLQGELVKLGRVRGIALVGLIWGVWHAPIILMGYNYPGYPIIGIFMMIAYCVGLAFVLGYAVLKTSSVWLAAYLHGVNNQTYSFLTMLVYAPAHPIFSFGIGLGGLASLGLVALLITTDPLWKER